ncbi:M20/M25/M40 family metallo-hydrolase [Anaeromicrobium sediminis]|nr:M20/M25/M40 family metallo-hydrolase [Anaeromicrobium sediminis]
MLKWNNPEGLKELAMKLIGQRSVSGTTSEIDMAKLIYNTLGEADYFNENPQNLFLQDIDGDLLGRKFVGALMEGKGKSKDTLVLVGHMDTVDVQDFGLLKEYAFNPYEYTKRLDPDALFKDAKEDLLSGEWLFGRGTMDMKTGMAWQMSLLEEYSMKNDFEGNFLFLAVPDEESNSAGALAAIPFVNRLAEERGLNPIAVLNCEPNFGAYPGDNNKYVYLGTAGKILPGFFFVGKESHVGESLAGLNVNMIGAEFMRRLEVDTELCDEVDGEVTVPPTCLKYKDLKELYSAQTPITSIAYYNLQTLSMSPKVALDKFRKMAEEALDECIRKVEEQGDIYKKRSNLPVRDIKFKPRVLLYTDLYDMAKEVHGDYLDKHIEECMNKWKDDTTLDERELNTKLIAEVHSLCPVREPMIVMFFAPPYYPHVGLHGKNEFERNLINLSDRLIDKAEKDFDEKILKQKYFQGLSDLSYFALQDAEEVIDYLVPNTPSWGVRYKFPVEEIRKLDLPVINFGPHGRDPHKFTERILLEYSYEKGPKLLRFLVDEIFKL